MEARARPRIRLIQALYLAALVAVASSDGGAGGGAGLILLQALAFGLVVIAVLGRLWTSAFIAGRKDEVLVTHGPFAACRHPLYLFSLLGAAGIGLASARLTLAIGLPLAIALIHVRKAAQEDAALASRHGRRWTDYAAQVPAFWPRQSLFAFPDSVELRLGIYRKAYLDAASFLALWLAVVLLDGLRRAALWPALFTLP